MDAPRTYATITRTWPAAGLGLYTAESHEGTTLRIAAHDSQEAHDKATFIFLRMQPTEKLRAIVYEGKLGDVLL